MLIISVYIFKFLNLTLILLFFNSHRNFNLCILINYFIKLFPKLLILKFLLNADCCLAAEIGVICGSLNDHLKHFVSKKKKFFSIKVNKYSFYFLLLNCLNCFFLFQEILYFIKRFLVCFRPTRSLVSREKEVQLSLHRFQQIPSYKRFSSLVFLRCHNFCLGSSKGLSG